MAAYSVRINTASFEKKVMAALKEKSYRVAYNKAYSLFKRAYGAMLREYDLHPITLEIRAGADAINSSGTLGGYGNLYSFIGFEAPANPTEDLRILLEQGTNFRAGSFRNGAWFFHISTPSRQQIHDATGMPWEIGSSWAEGIESGISNLSNYVYKKSKRSRSGMGIQIPHEYTEDLRFERTKYLSEIFGNFRERIVNSRINSA